MYIDVFSLFKIVLFEIIIVIKIVIKINIINFFFCKEIGECKIGK